MANTQLIVWDRDNQVFRTAHWDSTGIYRGWDLSSYLHCENEAISPDSLNLVASLCLGQVNVSEDQPEDMERKDYFERFGAFRRQTLSGILDQAKKVAGQHNVPYFGVNLVKTDKEEAEPRRFKSGLTIGSLVREIKELKSVGTSEYSYSPGILRHEELKPEEFVLHPTAQLYVPRRE